MLRRPLTLGARFRALLGPDAAGVRQSLAALVVCLLASLVAGLTLGSITGTLEALPGLLVLVPAAISLRGTIFGALGSRLSTTIHTGTFSLSRRRETVVGQNIEAVAVLTLSTALALAVLAKGVGVAFGLEKTISIPDFVVISIVAAILASIVLLGFTLGLAAGAVRFGWDMDNVTAPVVTAAGDMVTLPALFLATALVGIDIVTPALAAVLSIGSVAALAVTIRAGLPLVRRIVLESLPIVVSGGLLSLIAGLSIEKRLDSFATYPVLLVLVPPFLASAGALGGILSSRLSSKLHLGVVEPTSTPGYEARRDIALTFALALPIFVLASMVADVVAAVVDLNSPGALRILLVSLVGGTIATTFAVAVAYYGGIASYRLGLDPDTYGIPLVTSTLDLVGAIALITAIVLVGIT
jgi:mgtE-like transporter